MYLQTTKSQVYTWLYVLGKKISICDWPGLRYIYILGFIFLVKKQVLASACRHIRNRLAWCYLQIERSRALPSINLWLPCPSNWITVKQIIPQFQPRAVTMSRASDRTVFIYNGQGNNKQLGGLVNNEGITNNNFFGMLEILLIFRSSYTLRLKSGGMVPHDDAQLLDGKYYVDGKSKTSAHS